MEDLVLERLLKDMPPLLSMSGMFLVGKFLFLHLTLALVVYRDAVAQERCALEVPPPLWGLMVLVSPIWGLLVYWLLHHSVLMRQRQNTLEQLREENQFPLSSRASRSARIARGPSEGRSDVRHPPR